MQFTPPWVGSQPVHIVSLGMSFAPTEGMLWFNIDYRYHTWKDGWEAMLFESAVCYLRLAPCTHLSLPLPASVVIPEESMQLDRQSNFNIAQTIPHSIHALLSKPVNVILLIPQTASAALHWRKFWRR